MRVFPFHPDIEFSHFGDVFVSITCRVKKITDAGMLGFEIEKA